MSDELPGDRLAAMRLMAGKKQVSFFEFWPMWLMYLPVVVQWLWLSLRYRSLTLPLVANPSLKLSGMVGMPKSELMVQARGAAAQSILPWVLYQVTEETAAKQTKTCLAQASAEGINLPLVCKPDIGCRGAGVKLVETEQKLEEIIAQYPPTANLLCQKLASYEPEAGIFYVRDPETGKTSIPSITIKVLPRVIGNGVDTLGQLIAKDPRAGKLSFLYEKRHKDRWNKIPSEGEIVRLVFSASHSKGAIFTNAKDQLTDALKDAVDEIASGLPDFYYGRMDIKFRDLEALQSGTDLEVIEINGASSESIHIWDKNTRFGDAIGALLWQYRTLFKIGAYHRQQGAKTPSLRAFLVAWKAERSLTRYYPVND